MSGYDITATFLLALLLIGYALHRRAQRIEAARRAAINRHPATRVQRLDGYDPERRGDWK